MSNIKDIILSEVSYEPDTIFKCDDTIGSTVINKDNNGKQRIEMLMDISLELRAHIVEALLPPEELNSILEKNECEGMAEAFECGACDYSVSFCYYENYYPNLSGNGESGKAVTIECNEIYSNKTYAILPNSQEWFLDCFKVGK